MNLRKAKYDERVRLTIFSVKVTELYRVTPKSRTLDEKVKRGYVSASSA